jgi:hypothetical protein
VEKKERALIITDGADSTTQMAAAISAVLDGCQVVVCPAETFKGTDLLPVRAFALGCEKPRPSSFAYLEEMLAHINLAGRRCGVFSTGGDTLKYLAALVKDSDVSLGEPLLAEDSAVQPAVLKRWVNNIFASPASS